MGWESSDWCVPHGDGAGLPTRLDPVTFVGAPRDVFGGSTSILECDRELVVPTDLVRALGVSLVRLTGVVDDTARRVGQILAADLEDQVAAEERHAHALAHDHVEARV